MEILSIDQIIKKLGDNLISHDGKSQIVVSHSCANSLDEWLEKQGFSYEGRGIDPNSHIYDRHSGKL